MTEGPRDRTRGWSLRARLTTLSAALLAVALVAGAIVLSGVVAAGRVAALDDIARHRAQLVAGLARTDRVPDVLPVAEPGEIAQLLDADGTVLATSSNASRTLPVVPADELRGLRVATTVRTTTRSAYGDEARIAVVPTTWGGREVTAVATVPLREVHGVVRALRLSLLVVVPVLTLVLAAVIWVVIGRALRPVDQMRRAAADVARSGGPGVIPVPRHDDELAALARTLNDMLDDLRRAAARQRSFVADAAHELRSPIASLRTAADVARRHPDSYTVVELSGVADAEVRRLQQLVDDLLVLVRLGERPFDARDLDLAVVVRETVAGAARREGVRVELVGSGTASGDAAACGRIVRNLVDNAVRYAESVVVVEVADGVVTVDDDGPGIAEADRERVFERFARLDPARGRDMGGTGLGLAIARETARECDGEVVLAGSELGGLRAVVTLPGAGRERPPARRERSD